MSNKYHADKLQRIYEEVCWPSFDLENTGLYPNPIECPKYPGYYYVPFSKSPFLVNREGHVLNLYNGRTGYNPETEGTYYQFVYRDLSGARKMAYVHRVVALMFLAPSDDPNKDEINHKDGNRYNNHYLNLEWVTRAGNIQHAYDNELQTLQTPVLAKDVRTGEVVRFITATSCAERFQLGYIALIDHLKSPHSGRVTRAWHVFKYDDARPWPSFPEEFHAENSRGWLCDTLVINVETGQKLLFSSVRDACKALGKAVNTIYHHLRKRPEEPHKGWLFKCLDVNTNDEA